ncbi:MAG: tRNA lysidine(34) synthetase TilS, partial [Candidatus Sulfotelmatobacter sp.]
PWAVKTVRVGTATLGCPVRYHVAVHSLAERVLLHIRRQELLRAGDRVGVAVSGGIDSVALMRLLLELQGELGIVLSVVHFNHKLRGAESDADEHFVADLAVAHGLEFFVDCDDVAERAREDRVSVETAARELRYGFFRYLLGEGNPSVEAADGAAQSRALSKPHLGSTLDKIVTGHTLDDQAETVLMRMIRGTGMRGLGGIYPRLPVEDDSGDLCGEIVRPFLTLRRRELEAYLKAVGQPWREDSSNANHAFTRNRLRQLILPVLENEFNPAIAETISDLADIARGEEDYWENEISGWMGTVVHWSEPDWARRAATSGLVNINLGTSLAPAESSNEGSANDLQSKIESAAWLLMNASISRVWFVTESEAVQRRLIKAIGEHAGIPLEFKHVEEIRRLAAHDSEGKELSLPLGWKFVREADELIFLTPDLRIEPPAHDYEYELSVPGRVIVPEIGAAIQIYRIVGGGSGYNPDHLLDADSLCGPLRVRNWRAGDRFWPAHTKSAKKIKELLQERQISGAGRKLWPVVLIRSDEGDEIIWVRGFPVPAKYAAKPGGSSMVICETPLADE